MNPLKAEGLKASAVSESRGWDGAESKRGHSLEGPRPWIPSLHPSPPGRGCGSSNISRCLIGSLCRLTLRYSDWGAGSPEEGGKRSPAEKRETLGVASAGQGPHPGTTPGLGFPCRAWVQTLRSPCAETA